MTKPARPTRRRLRGRHRSQVGRAAPATSTPAPASVARQSETSSPGFEPTASQLKYVLALEEAIETRSAHSDKALAARLKISRQTIYEWKQDPSFRAWWRALLDRTSDEHWPLILRRHELLAIQGSVRSAEFIAKVRTLGTKGGGFTPETEGGTTIQTQYHINLLVPRPPEPGHTE